MTSGPPIPQRNATDPAWFRRVLGQYPTGVCIITAADPAGEPAGMVVGSFTSVSLDPPLVAFLPDRASASWRLIGTSDHFCVNIVGADQEPVCRRFAAKSSQAEKFAGVAHHPSPLGSPIIEGAVAWIDCVRDAVHEAGDHLIVVGAVRDLQIESGGLPLLFFQGGYGRFWPLSLTAEDPLGRIADQLRNVELARSEMERLATELRGRCIATVRVDDEIIVAASADHSTRGAIPSLVGQRLPFIPPTGSIFAAWYSETAMRDWLNATSEPRRRDEFLGGLREIRNRGYSIGLISEAQREFATTMARLAIERTSARDLDLRETIQNLSFDPPELDAEVFRAVRLVSVPVFSPSCDVAMALTVYEFDKPEAPSDVQRYVGSALSAAAAVGARLS